MATTRLLASAFLATALLAPLLAAAPAMAGTEWDKAHPRRAEVNARIHHQEQRITRERREGEITRQQAQSLRASDRAIGQQERADAARHGGHITRTEQRTLNQELNGVSRAIGH